MSTLTDELAEALRTIVARLNGVWDDPALLAQGPLSQMRYDCLHHAQAGIAKYNAAFTQQPTRSQHTPEPWCVDLRSSLSPDESIHIRMKHGSSDYVARVYREGSADPSASRCFNARRIVTCVNACAGLSNEALERGDVVHALETVDNLLGDYARGELRGGSIDWDDLDATVKYARCMFPGRYKAALEKFRGEYEDKAP